MVGGIFGTKSQASARAIQKRAVAGSRLGIPLLFAEDVIHGHRTIFPLPVALACSWNTDLIEETAHFAAREAAAEGIHQVYAPMIDVSRDPRWGRVAESPGEDPLLAGRVAAAMVRGFQGEDPAASDRVAACLKHFVAYGAPQSGRDYDNASLAWEDLLEIYLPPFAAGLEAGAISVMAGFNAVNKVPMHAHRELIEGWLRTTQGFGGLVVSDYTGVMELSAHGIGERDAAVLRALEAGIDMDMVGEDYLSALPALAESGSSAEEAGFAVSAEEVGDLIDRACLRVLTFKVRMGLFDDPFARTKEGVAAPPRDEGMSLARRAAAESAVLLKNGGVLPLSNDRRIALIGPLAEDQANMLGTWSVSGDARDVRSLRAAVEDILGRRVPTVIGANVVDEPWLIDRLNVHGTTIAADERSAEEMIAEAVQAARAADVAIVAVGEAKEHAGESSSRLAPDLPDPQQALLRALADVGTPLVVLVFAGRPLALGPAADVADALVYCWHGGVRGPDGVADLLFGRSEPSARLAVTLPAHPGQTPLHHTEEPTGRPDPGEFQKFRTGWLDLPDGERGFPFGFGLGYGDVSYGQVRTSAAELAGGAALEVSVEIRNAGRRPQIETVQLFLSDPVARITRPARWLADFRQVRLAPGETHTVTFAVTREMSAYWIAPSLAAAERVWDPGEIIIHVGPNSRDTQSACVRWTA
jgi:beta-glucosidase